MNRLFLWGALATTVIGFAIALVRQHDNRVRAEALAAQYQKAFSIAQEEAASIDIRLQEREAELTARQIVLDSVREELERRIVRESTAVDESVNRVAVAGATLSATIDTIAAIAPNGLRELIESAQEQHAAERAATEDLVGAFQRRLASEHQLRLTAESETSIWRDRHAELTVAYDARGAALEAAEAALAAQIVVSESPWYTPVVTVLKYVAVGGAGYAFGASH